MLGKAGNQVNANVGEFCSISFVFQLYGAFNYLDIFLIHAYAIKCVKKPNFLCKWFTRNVLSKYKKIRSTG